MEGIYVMNKWWLWRNFKITDNTITLEEKQVSSVRNCVEASYNLSEQSHIHLSLIIPFHKDTLDLRRDHTGGT